MINLKHHKIFLVQKDYLKTNILYFSLKKVWLTDQVVVRMFCWSMNFWTSESLAFTIEIALNVISDNWEINLNFVQFFHEQIWKIYRSFYALLKILIETVSKNIWALSVIQFSKNVH
jgi:hypothetical protein